MTITREEISTLLTDFLDAAERVVEAWEQGLSKEYRLAVLAKHEELEEKIIALILEKQGDT